MAWHIVTGEFPPQRGGVSDYTYHLAEGHARRGREVHIWAPGTQPGVTLPIAVHLHPLPRGFGLRWLRALDRGLSAYSGEQMILVQYVPHMYGWKSMNLPFCCWLARLRRNVWVMFHEVAFPFLTGQPLRHRVLATVHRLMARIVLSGEPIAHLRRLNLISGCFSGWLPRHGPNSCESSATYLSGRYLPIECLAPAI